MFSFDKFIKVAFSLSDSETSSQTHDLVYPVYFVFHHGAQRIKDTNAKMSAS